MCMWELLFPSRNLSACLEKRMESCWDGWVCVREMLEIAEELSEKKAMDLIWGSSFARRLATCDAHQLAIADLTTHPTTFENTSRGSQKVRDITQSKSRTPVQPFNGSTST